MQRARGVTLIELMITIAVLAILLGLAVPSFSGLILDGERTSAVNGFLHGLLYARSEAARRNRIVAVCKSSDGATCAPKAAWHDGWIAFINSNREEPPHRTPDEELLFQGKPWGRGTITSNRTSFTFRPYQQGVINGTLVFCDSRGSDHARAIILSHTGRPRVSARDASKKPLRCPSS